MTTILHVIPSLAGGGSERQVAALALEQRRRGWSVHVALRRGGVHESAVRAGGVTVHGLGDLPGLHPLLVARLGRLTRTLAPHILQTWLPQMDVVGAVVASLVRVPWVLTERSTAQMYREIPYVRRLREVLGRGAAAIVANSTEGADYWRALSSRRMPITTVSNAVDVEQVRAAPPLHGGTADAPLLLCVGRLHGVKGTELLVDAMSRLPEHVRAVLIGDGPLREDLLRKIGAAGLGGRMELQPYRPDWWGYLKSSAALVSPSRIEGQPNVVLEAMAGGCPLVVSDIPAHREVLDDSSALFFAGNDSLALADAVTKLLADAGAARRRAESAARRVSTRTAQAAASAYENVYGAVLADSARR